MKHWNTPEIELVDFKKTEGWFTDILNYLRIPYYINWNGQIDTNIPGAGTCGSGGSGEVGPSGISF